MPTSKPLLKLMVNYHTLGRKDPSKVKAGIRAARRRVSRDRALKHNILRILNVGTEPRRWLTGLEVWEILNRKFNYSGRPKSVSMALLRMSRQDLVWRQLRTNEANFKIYEYRIKEKGCSLFNLAQVVPYFYLTKTELIQKTEKLERKIASLKNENEDLKRQLTWMSMRLKALGATP